MDHSSLLKRYNQYTNEQINISSEFSRFQCLTETNGVNVVEHEQAGTQRNMLEQAARRTHSFMPAPPSDGGNVSHVPLQQLEEQKRQQDEELSDDNTSYSCWLLM